MSEQDNLKLVQSIMEDYVKGNVQPPSEELLAEDAEWILSGSIDDPVAGRYHGRENIKQAFAMHNQIVEAEADWCTVKDYIVQGDKVVAYGNEKIRLKPSNRVVECSFVYVITVREGKIVQWHSMYGYP